MNTEKKTYAKAIQRNIHVSSRKAKIVCDLIRNKPVNEALSILEHTNKKSAYFLIKLLNQAISNGINNHALQANKLYVYKVVANQGTTLKRTSPRAKGSADLIRKRHTHLEIVVSDDPNQKEKELKLIKEKIKKRALKNKGFLAKQKTNTTKPIKAKNNEKNIKKDEK